MNEPQESAARKKNRGKPAKSAKKKPANAASTGKKASVRKPKAESSPKTPAEGARAGRSRRAELNHAVILELRALRTKINRATEAFDLRLGGRVSELLQTLEGDPSLGQKPKPMTVKSAQATLERLGSLRAKPKRGQLKDLRRLERAVRRLDDVAPGA